MENGIWMAFFFPLEKRGLGHGALGTQVIYTKYKTTSVETQTNFIENLT